MNMHGHLIDTLVETLYWVSKIIRNGSKVFTDIIKNDRMGLRSFSVSGRVKNPGLYLLPSGSTILDIISASGGMLDGHVFKAYQPGGASSGLRGSAAPKLQCCAGVSSLADGP